MCVLKPICATLFLALSTITFAQDIPPGTVIPVRLNSSVSLKMQPRAPISARVMQDVPLPSGRKIRAGARVVGHVVAVKPAANGANAQISFTFDRIVFASRSLQVTTDLRAMASFVEVDEAQIPETGADRGTPDYDRTTVLIGGDVDYRSDGPVMEGSRIVGYPVSDGVISQVSPAGSSCRGVAAGNDAPQALWLFSADACGLYGFPNLRIAHAGRTVPIGDVILTSSNDKLKIPGGAGLLLRVVSSAANM